MKQITLILLILSIIHMYPTFAQEDSVVVKISNGMVPEYEIYSEIDGTITVQRCEYFKDRYWPLGERTLDQKERKKFKRKLARNWKNKYQTIHRCDSLVNEIQNSCSYWNVRYELHSIAEEKYDDEKVKTFKDYLENNDTEISNFSEVCHSEYLKRLSIYREQVLKEWRL